MNMLKADKQTNSAGWMRDLAGHYNRARVSYRSESDRFSSVRLAVAVPTNG